MILTINSHEYSYHNSPPSFHHEYLFPKLLPILANASSSLIKETRLLDIGCGNGSLTNQIANQGYQVTGIEESLSGIQYAKKHYPNCQFLQGSVYSEPPQEFLQAFDIVISAEVIEHLCYPKELVKYARKCLKTNGTLIITTPYHGYFKNLLLAVSGKMDDHFTSLWDGGHIKFFSVVTLRKLLENEGFTGIKFKFAGRLPYVWKSMLCFSTLNSES